MAKYKVCWDEVVLSTGAVRGDSIEFEYTGQNKRAAFEKMYWDSLQKNTNAIFGFDVYSATRGGAPIYEGKGVMWVGAKRDIWLDTLSANELKQFIKYLDKRLKEEEASITDWVRTGIGLMMRLASIQTLASKTSLLQWGKRKAIIIRLADIHNELSPEEAYKMGD